MFVTCTALANVNKCCCMPPIWRTTWSGNAENNLLLLNIYCNAIDKHTKPQFREQSRKSVLYECVQASISFYKGDQTPCKLLLVRRQNAQWTFSEFLFGLSFKWKFATQ